MKHFLILIAIALTFISCQQNKKNDQIKTKDQIPATESDCVKPDENSFFPLLLGSAWYYADYISGERDPSSVARDSVVGSTKTDSGYFVTTTHYSISDKSTDTVYYLANCKNEVYKQISLRETPEIFALLSPQIGDKIGNMTYDSYCSPQSEEHAKCLRLEEYPYDSATSQEAKMKWQYSFFEKGIGITSKGGDELTIKLEKYKIGTSEFITR